jgi:hypothetical protein
MELPIENLNETTPLAYESRLSSSLLPLDPNETLDLHRAINERRAQVENAELLKHLRSM